MIVVRRSRAASHLRAALFGVAVTATLTNGVAAQQPASAGEQDRRAVVAVVQRLFDAMRARDTASLRDVFEPGARLVGIRTRPDGTPVFQAITPAQFATFLSGDKRGVWLERGFNPEVQLEGTLATVWIDYDFHLGDKFSHCGVDAAQLLKLNGIWKIVSLADTYQTQGCPTRPAVGAPADARAPEDILGSHFNSMAEAWNRGDLAGHIAPYADSAMFMGANGPVTGRALIGASLERSFWRDGKPRQNLRFERVNVRMLGANSALVTGRFILSGGDLKEQSGWFSTSWQRNAAGWQIVHDHSS